MILNIDSDAAYLVVPVARSRVSGYFYLTEKVPPQNPKCPNAPVLVESKVLRHVVSSAAEAEVAGVYHNAQVAVPIRTFLQELGHEQPPTPIKTDNSTAAGFVNDNIQQRRSKSWDMRYHWLRDRITKEQFRVYWDKGINNWADYQSKHHPLVHHAKMRGHYIRDHVAAICK